MLKAHPKYEELLGAFTSAQQRVRELEADEGSHFGDIQVAKHRLLVSRARLEKAEASSVHPPRHTIRNSPSRVTSDALTESWGGGDVGAQRLAQAVEDRKDRILDQSLAMSDESYRKLTKGVW